MQKDDDDDDDLIRFTQTFALQIFNVVYTKTYPHLNNNNEMFYIPIIGS